VSTFQSIARVSVVHEESFLPSIRRVAAITGRAAAGVDELAGVGILVACRALDRARLEWDGTSFPLRLRWCMTASAGHRCMTSQQGKVRGLMVELHDSPRCHDMTGRAFGPVCRTSLAFHHMRIRMTAHTGLSGESELRHFG